MTLTLITSLAESMRSAPRRTISTPRAASATEASEYIVTLVSDFPGKLFIIRDASVTPSQSGRDSKTRKSNGTPRVDAACRRLLYIVELRDSVRIETGSLDASRNTFWRTYFVKDSLTASVTNVGGLVVILVLGPYL